MLPTWHTPYPDSSSSVRRTWIPYKQGR